jgi:prophage DNA circulation protein
MTINGIEINETTDIREIVLVFNSLLIQAEGLKDELITNFNTYQNIDTHSADTLQKYKEVLQSITAIQIESQDAFEKVAKLDANLIERVSYLQKKIQDENKETYQNIKLLLSQLEPFTQKAINSAVRHVQVDTSGIEASIERKLEGFDVSDINQTIHLIDERSQILQAMNEKFHRTSDALKSTHVELQEHTQALENTVSDVNEAVQSFKGINKSVSTGVKITFLSLGLIAGFGVATFFKIDALSNYYFSHHDKKQKEIINTQKLLEEKLSKLEKLPEFLLQHHIDIRYGIYDDDSKKTPYLRFKKSLVYPNGSSYTFERKGEKFIGFKNE